MIFESQYSMFCSDYRVKVGFIAEVRCMKNIIINLFLNDFKGKDIEMPSMTKRMLILQMFYFGKSHHDSFLTRLKKRTQKRGQKQPLGLCSTRVLHSQTPQRWLTVTVKEIQWRLVLFKSAKAQMSLITGKMCTQM